MYVLDTIVAPATPSGRGAVAVVRLSGPDAIAIARRLWRPQRALDRMTPRRLYLGAIRDPASNKLLDRALCVVMPGPRSFTGEDVAELHCHGGIYLVRRIVALAAAEGARIAQPGEFTRRAFLNGRMSLTEAEAIADLIDARNGNALEQSAAQMAGALKFRIDSLRQRLISIRAHLEAQIDFSEEDIDLPSHDQIASQLRSLSGDVEALYQSFAHGRIVREGARAAIIGKPNVGKSSVLNLLLGVERAIVTATPGTTRDLIEESLDLGDYSLVLIDTAGIRESSDEVERIGISRAGASAQQADLLIPVFDSSRPLEAEDMAVIDLARGRSGVALLNKRDLRQQLCVNNLRSAGLTMPLIDFSAVLGQGLDDCREALTREVRRLIDSGDNREDAIVISRERHRDALGHALNALKSAEAALTGRMPPEIVALEIAGASEALGSITGEMTSEDVLDAIFREFCIGK
jgi:tRNA modification GTPase